MNDKVRKNVIITGLSGAGISSVLKAMEDLRFEVFDNFPLSLIPSVIEDASQKQADCNGIAIGVDTRTRGFSADAVLDMVEKTGALLVFITCDENILVRRFSETRRRHPMAQDRTVSHGISAERELLSPLRDRADIILDSTNTSVHDIRHMLEGHFSLKPDKNLTVSLLSFGFKNGVPREANIVMDVRFLKNPHWDSVLKPMTGKDKAVGDYIMQDDGFEPFLNNFKAMLEPLLPRYAGEGRSYLTIAIGCTGGRHRSVFTVELLQKWLEEKGVKVFAEHRDLKL